MTKQSLISTPRFDRRTLLRMGAGTALVAVTPLPAFATPDDMRQAQIALFGDTPIKTGRVNLKLPTIAENGFSVSLNVQVDSPMSADDYVRQIAVFSSRNPISELARFELGPRAGKAEVSTRIRLSGTQTVNAVAEMSDGTLWSGSAETVVTLAACVIM